MAEQATSFVQEGREWIESTRDRIDEEIQKVQKEVQTRRKRLERRYETNRKRFERQTRKQVKQLQSELRSYSIVQRVEELQSEATQQIENIFESVLGALQIASSSDVKKIDRKLTKLTKRLKDIETARRSNGQQAPSEL
jgi:Skp family chaperone for outer membrane proteins